MWQQRVPELTRPHLAQRGARSTLALGCNAGARVRALQARAPETMPTARRLDLGEEQKTMGRVCVGTPHPSLQPAEVSCPHWPCCELRMNYGTTCPLMRSSGLATDFGGGTANRGGTAAWPSTINALMASWDFSRASETCLCASQTPSTGTCASSRTQQVYLKRWYCLTRREPEWMAALIPRLLQKMPTCLRVESTEGRDEPLQYDLKSDYDIWSRDAAGNAKVKRRGFRLVPDFANTAHGYCGDTLEKCKGDLLEWSKVPTLEAMQRGYIIKSRVLETDRCLILRPYSPMLFQQGTLQGPHILLERQRGEVTVAELKKRWKKVSVAEESPQAKWVDWPWTMQLPCRHCTDRGSVAAENTPSEEVTGLCVVSPAPWTAYPKRWRKLPKDNTSCVLTVKETSAKLPTCSAKAVLPSSSLLPPPLSPPRSLLPPPSSRGLR